MAGAFPAPKLSPHRCEVGTTRLTGQVCCERWLSGLSCLKSWEIIISPSGTRLFGDADCISSAFTFSTPHTGNIRHKTVGTKQAQNIRHKMGEIFSCTASRQHPLVTTHYTLFSSVVSTLHTCSHITYLHAGIRFACGQVLVCPGSQSRAVPGAGVRSCRLEK